MIWSQQIQSFIGGGLYDVRKNLIISVVVASVQRHLLFSLATLKVSPEGARWISLQRGGSHAAEYLQLQYRKLHESEAYLTGLTKSQLMRLALAGKAPELGYGAVKVPRAAPPRNQTTENTAENDRFIQGELFSDDEYC